MKNGILYVTNNNEKYLNMTVNSINSLFHFNPKLIDNTTVFIVTDDANLDISKIDEGIKCQLIVIDTNKYRTPKNRIARFNRPYYYYRFDMFSNPLFKDLDNLLYLDADTEVGGTIEELFVEHDKPVIHLVEDIDNPLRARGGVPKYGDLMCDHYYNSGFIFITPLLMGEERLAKIYDCLVELVNRFDFQWPDQDALNAMLGLFPDINDLVVPLPKAYNYAWSTKPKCTAKESRAATDYKVKHYVGLKKYEFRFLKKGTK